jgi:hypothetical protein
VDRPTGALEQLTLIVVDAIRRREQARRDVAIEGQLDFGPGAEKGERVRNQMTDRLHEEVNRFHGVRGGHDQPALAHLPGPGAEHMACRIEVPRREITGPAPFEEAVVEDLDIGAANESRR